MDDVIVNKTATIERCVARVREVYDDNPNNLTQDLLRQDSIVLNMQRGCEAAVGLAMHLCRKRQLGVPQHSRDAFRFLVDHELIGEDLGERLERMVGFRNVAVHDYQSLNLAIVRAIIDHHLGDLLTFSKQAIMG